MTGDSGLGYWLKWALGAATLLGAAIGAAFRGAVVMGRNSERLDDLEEWRGREEVATLARDLRLTGIEEHMHYIRGRIDEALGFRK